MKLDCTIKDFGHCPVPENWVVDMTHRINRLYYIHSGKGGYQKDGKNIPLQAGRIYFIPYTADASFYSEQSDPLVHTWCDFQLTAPIVSRNILSFVAEEAIDKAALAVFLEGGQIEETRWKGGSAIAEEENFQALFIRAVLFLSARAAELAGVVPVKDVAITRALEVMHAGIADKVSVKSLADGSFLSEGGFIRKFTREVGMTPYAYLKTLRVKTALSLKEQGYTLDDIATRTGYADASSLLHSLRSRN
ncbi:MAG: helix-turn-helix domain-containing protein [Clostridia bacterium]|nr:helix-turn-helix domain-containing protein [Clostridia bacterium]